MKKQKLKLDELKIESFWTNPNPEQQLGGFESGATFGYACNACGGGGGGNGGTTNATFGSNCGTGGTYWPTYANCYHTRYCPTDYNCGGGSTNLLAECNTQDDPNGIVCTTPGQYPGC